MMRTFLSAILLLIGIPLAGQISRDARFQQLTVADGLPSNNINDIAQDADGSIWIATENGLCRYDGYGTEIFMRGQDDKRTLPHSRVFALTCDPEGKLWAATSYGLCYFDQRSRQFVRLADIADLSPLANHYNRHIEAGADGKIWFTNSMALCCWDQRAGKIAEYRIPELDAPYIYSMHLGAGGIWLGVNNKLLLFDTVASAFTILDISADIALERNQFISAIASQGDNAVIASSTGIILRRKAESQHFVPMRSPWPKREINAIGKLTNGELVFMAENCGIAILGPKSGEIAPLPNPFFIPADNRSISAVFQDRQGNVWLGHRYSGVSYANPYTNFHHISNQHPYARQMQSNTVTAVGCIGNKAVVTTKDGGVYAMLRGGIVQSLPLGRNTREITSVTPIGADTLALYAPGKGMYICPSNGTVSVADIADNQLIINRYARGSDGSEWFATQGRGLLRKLHGKWMFITQNEGLSGDWVNDIVIDRDNTVWAATNYGLSRITADGKIQIFRHDTEDIHSLSNNTIFSLLIDRRGTLWCGTQEGICAAAKGQMRFVQFAGGRNVCANSLAEDKHGTVWAGTNSGLMHLSATGEILSQYGMDCGMPISSFAPRASAVSADGYLYFGGVGGFIYFHPDSLSVNSVSPNLFLTDVQINSRSVFSELVADRDNSSQMDLGEWSYKQNNLMLNFSADNFIHPQGNVYEYRIVGLSADTSWVDLHGQRQLHFRSLPPGNYTIELRASNSDGTRAQHPLRLTVRISPPFWQTGLFIVMIFILAGAAIVAIIRIRTAALIRSKINLETTVELRTRDLKRAMDELARTAAIVAEQNLQLSATADQLQAGNIELQIQKKELDAKTLSLQESVAALEKASHTQSMLTSLIAHDIRNPFSALMLAGQMLKDRFHTAPDTKKLELIDVINSSSANIYGLMNNMLDWARSQTGQLLVKPENVPLSGLISETVHLLRPLADAKQIEIRIDASAQVYAWADRTLLHTVIRNLLGNAIKFSHPQGLIEICAHRSDTDEHIIISIADNGTGMPPEVQAKLNAGMAHSQYGTGNEHGTGIGMLVCTEFVALIGGAMWFESEVSRGTTFFIDIPGGIDYNGSPVPYKEPEPATAVPEPVKPKIQPMLGKRIVIAEDNDTIRRYLEDEISPYFRTESAPDGEAALSLIRQYPPDLILTDIDMPGTDGIELCRQVKHSIETAHIPVLILTARRGDDIRLQGLGAGVVDYVLKPFDITELLLKMKNILTDADGLQSRSRVEQKTDELPADHDTLLMQKFVEIIQQEYPDADLSVEDVGQRVGLSRSHLYKKCMAQMGRSPLDYLQEVRMQNALLLLKNTSLNVSEVAFRVGYSDPRYFSSRFRKFTGMSPTELRDR